MCCVPEINMLKGADAIFEEEHFMLGTRGIRRAMKFMDSFIAELTNITEIAKKYNNLNVLFPYIYDPQELSRAIDVLDKIKFPGKFGIMAEIPSTILLLEEFTKQGISNITIGVNDLTSLTLGTARGEYLNHTHPAVIKLIEMAVSIGAEFKIPVSVAGYVSPELELICKTISVDNFIVHYHLLPDILKIQRCQQF